MKYVQGYYRGKDETKTKKGEPMIAAVIAGAMAFFLAIMFWYITLTVVVVGSGGYLLHKHYARRVWQRENGLQVNYLNGKQEYI